MVHTIRDNRIALTIRAQATRGRILLAPAEFVVRPKDIFQVSKMQTERFSELLER